MFSQTYGSMFSTHPFTLTATVDCWNRQVTLGFTSLNVLALRSYSPIKNDAMEASHKQKKGLEPACAFSFEMDVYRCGDYLRSGGMEIGDELPEAEYQGVRGSIPPTASLSARFVSGQGKNNSGRSLAPGSLLVIKGEVTLKTDKVEQEKALTMESQLFLNGVGGSTGCSIWPGNINELIFKLCSYKTALQVAAPPFVSVPRSLFRSLSLSVSASLYVSLALCLSVSLSVTLSLCLSLSLCVSLSLSLCHTEHRHLNH